MSEELRKALSEILVNSYKAFHLIPLKTNRDERKTMDEVDSLVNEVAKILNLDAEREVEELCQADILAQHQKIDDDCMLISRESEIQDEDYLIDLERIVLGR